MKAPGYALAWVKSLKSKDQPTIEQGDK